MAAPGPHVLKATGGADGPVSPTLCVCFSGTGEDEERGGGGERITSRAHQLVSSSP